MMGGGGRGGHAGGWGPSFELLAVLPTTDSVLRFGHSTQPELMIQSITVKHTSACTSCAGLDCVGDLQGGGTTCQWWC